MLANFYLFHFDRLMLRHGFHLIRYADDFVVMCESFDRARQAHDLSREALKTLNLRIHALDEPGSKSKIGNFSKDGLMFLGIRFEGQETFPAVKVVERFRAKVLEVLKLESGQSLFTTLQKLRNLINGWGKCYRSMRVVPIYLDLDKFIKEQVEKYLERVGFRLVGKKARHMKLLGVPSLVAMVEYKQRTAPAPSTSPTNRADSHQVLTATA